MRIIKYWQLMIGNNAFMRWLQTPCLSEEMKKVILVYIHGLRYTRFYSILNNMKQRCSNPNKPDYKWYGGKGIQVCDEWKDSEHGLENFYNWSICNGYKDNLTIDRINSNGDYEPNNCRWISLSDQQTNKCNNVLITVDEKQITAKEYCEMNNINYRSFMSRLSRGWSLEKTLSKPYRNK